MKERFLPIGTIVLLKDGTKPIMVTSYCVFPAGTEIINNKEVTPKQEMFEYGGCPFPEGIINPNVIAAFNHNQIEKVIHEGYQNDEQKEYSKLLCEHYDGVKKQYESGQLTSKQMNENA